MRLLESPLKKRCRKMRGAHNFDRCHLIFELIPLTVQKSVIKYHEYEAEVVEKRQRRQENQYHGATGEHPKVDHCHKQLDEILDETLTAVEDIKLQALQMRVSLKKDENMLDRLQPLAESTNERLKRNLEKAKVLCK